jgi:hypothetical protein
MGRPLDGQLPPLLQEFFNLSTSCCQQLAALGLEDFIQEKPSSALIAQKRLEMMADKAQITEMLTEALYTFLRPLSEKLKALPTGPEAFNGNRQVIENILKKFDHAVTFPAAFTLHEALIFMEEVVDKALLTEFSQLYSFCRGQIIELGLKEYLHEGPVEVTRTVTPIAADPKKALIDIKQFTNELKFFRLMIAQKDADLDAWLKENNPKFDYPLLWGKKRISNISGYRDSVSPDLRSAWVTCCQTCLEKVKVDLVNIPEDASPELRAFLNSK